MLACGPVPFHHNQSRAVAWGVDLFTAGRTLQNREQTLPLSGDWGSPVAHELSVAPDGHALGVTTRGGQVMVVSLPLDGSKRVLEQQGYGPAVHAWSPDSRVLATGSDRRGLRLFRGATARSLPGPLATALAWPVPERLIAGDSGGAIWAVHPDTEVAEELGRCDSAIAGIDAVGDCVVAVTIRGGVHVFDGERRAALVDLDAVAIAMHPDGEHVAIAGRDGSLSLHRCWPLDCLSRRDHVGQQIHDLAWSPDGTELAVITNTARVQQFRLNGHRFDPMGHHTVVSGVDVGPDRIVSCCTRLVWVWDAHTGEGLAHHACASGAVWRDVCFDPDGGVLALASDARLHALSTGWTAEVDGFGLLTVGEHVVCATQQGLWVLHWPTRTARPSPIDAPIRGLARDGDGLIAVGADQTWLLDRQLNIVRTVDTPGSTAATRVDDTLVVIVGRPPRGQGFDLSRPHSLMGLLGEPPWIWQTAMTAVSANVATVPRRGLWRFDVRSGQFTERLYAGGHPPLHQAHDRIVCADGALVRVWDTR